MKVAIIHEWFTSIAGSERVVESILRIYPDADIYTIYADPETVRSSSFLANKRIHNSFISKLPFVSRIYRSYLPLMPLAIEQFDLSEYDLVISSSHAVAKGVLTGPDQLHICYVHSPMRYAWDLQHEYLRESNLQSGFKGWLAKWLLHKIRIWDYRTAAGVDHFVVNSKFIGRRVRKVYGRESTVIYPPVDIVSFELNEHKSDYYLTASRMVPYKRMDLVVKAFSLLQDKKLIVIGDGPDMTKIRKIAGPNVTLLGYQPFHVLKQHMQHAKAFVFAAEEDFGITPVEAQACGTPVIAYGKGGSLETVVESAEPEGQTGIWFHDQTAEAIANAIIRFEELSTPISAQACRKHAEHFSTDRFAREFTEYVNKRWTEFQGNSKTI